MMLLKPVFIIAIVAVIFVLVYLLASSPAREHDSMTSEEKKQAQLRWQLSSVESAKQKCIDISEASEKLESYYLIDQAFLELQECTKNWGELANRQGSDAQRAEYAKLIRAVNPPPVPPIITDWQPMSDEAIEKFVHDTGCSDKYKIKPNYYDPTGFCDAWKIENMDEVQQYRDRDGLQGSQELLRDENLMGLQEPKECDKMTTVVTGLDIEYVCITP